MSCYRATFSPHFSRANELTNYMENPKVHHHIHKSPPAVPILSRINSFHASPCYFLKNHFNIIPPFMPRSSSGLFPSGLPFMHGFYLPYMPHAPPASFFVV